jgi:hypothetical protein
MLLRALLLSVGYCRNLKFPDRRAPYQARTSGRNCVRAFEDDSAVKAPV